MQNIGLWILNSLQLSRNMYYLMQLHRFRQGLGRLIRNENDRGIIVSFDDRLINSNYKNFLNKHWKIIVRKGDIQQFGKLLRQIQKKK